MFNLSTTPAVRTLTAPNGQAVVTRLSYGEALALLNVSDAPEALALRTAAHAEGGLDKNGAIQVYAFAQAVINRRACVAEGTGITPPAEPAGHGEMTLAEEIAAEARTVEVEAPAVAPVQAFARFAPIVCLFETARANGGARLKIKVAIENARITLKGASDTSRNPGGVYVTDDTRQNAEGRDLYVGVITAGGTFKATRDCNGDIFRALERFTADPVRACAEYGHASGTCCFCARELTDDRTGSSVEVGYGPRCAVKFGLPHAGNRTRAAAAV